MAMMKSFAAKHRFMLICLLLIWFKTFLASILTFDTNFNQFIEILLFIFNPLLFLFVIFGLGLYLKPKLQTKYFFLASAAITGILYANVVYYREFSDILTLPMLLMSNNMGDLSTSIFALIHWADILYFIDIIILGYFLLKKNNVIILVTKISFLRSKAVISTVILVLAIAITQINAIDKAHAFNRQQLIQSLGLYNFYIYDAFLQTQATTQPVVAEKDDWTDIEDYLGESRVEPNDEFFGIAEDMNVLVVSMESVESFVIGETVNGEEITPFLNELIEDSFYFENFYYQTGQGKTSDAEFLINNSLYPLGRGAVFLTHAENKFKALPETLTNEGYYTANFHANDLSFYNREIMYENLGYDRAFSLPDFDVSIENSVGWGLKDIDFVEQSMDYIKEIPEPFYSTLLTLTNHFPYELDEEDHFIEPFDSESHIVNQYFPTVRYTDEAMRILVDRLKEEGLYDNTVLVMYGDHYGIAKSHYEELGKFLGKEISLHDEVLLDRVPFIIHIPGVDGEIMDTISGQIDVMPTLLNLLGIPEGDHVMFGNDLFSEDRENFAVLRDGTVITDENILVNEICLDYETGAEVDLDICKPLQDKGLWELYYSDKIIYRDLFRFLDRDEG
ncbi:MAG: LTA synthase family protein [Bacillus sp. (in: Bacteria)]|nr:LTA synthase family protein [Bacillus sp. (in: firmicutes)]